MTIVSSFLNKSAVIIIITNLKSYVPKHVRFYEQTKRSGIVSDLSRIGLRPRKNENGSQRACP